MIAAIILTLNEADDLPKCLDSLDWTDQNFVLDSGSTDDTCEIATSMGAIVYKNEFKGFGQQRCWATKDGVTELATNDQIRRGQLDAVKSLHAHHPFYVAVVS